MLVNSLAVVIVAIIALDQCLHFRRSAFHILAQGSVDQSLVADLPAKPAGFMLEVVDHGSVQTDGDARLSLRFRLRPSVSAKAGVK